MRALAKIDVARFRRKYRFARFASQPAVVGVNALKRRSAPRFARWLCFWWLDTCFVRRSQHARQRRFRYTAIAAIERKCQVGQSQRQPQRFLAHANRTRFFRFALQLDDFRHQLRTNSVCNSQLAIAVVIDLLRRTQACLPSVVELVGAQQHLRSFQVGC